MSELCLVATVVTAGHVCAHRHPQHDEPLAQRRQGGRAAGGSQHLHPATPAQQAGRLHVQVRRCRSGMAAGLVLLQRAASSMCDVVQQAARLLVRYGAAGLLLLQLVAGSSALTG